MNKVLTATMHNNWVFSWITSLALFAFVVISPALAQEYKGRGGAYRPGNGFQYSLQGGGVSQFQTDISRGGKFSVDRAYMEPGLAFTINPKMNLGLSLGYGYDGYDFAETTGFGGLNPWSDIHTLSLSGRLRWAIDDRWTLFAVPTLRSSVENGADLGDGFQGGGLTGLSYRFSDSLSIGPGIGVMTKIEADPNVFPLLLINWKITDTLSLRTGQGLGATRRPGLSLAWKFARGWEFTFGGRYETFRFLLDKDGAVPNGIGEERSIPIYGGLSYAFSPQVKLSLLGGINVNGELRAESEDGKQFIKQDYDNTSFLGGLFTVRF